MVRPVVVNLRSDDDDTIREKARQGLVGGTSGMLAVSNHGAEELLNQTREAVRAHYDLEGYSGVERCISCELSPADSALEGQLRNRLQAVSTRICRALLGEQFIDQLEAKSQKLDGRLSLRYYTPAGAGEADDGGQGGGDAKPALGPHVDGNLLTLLWSDGPGFQVPSASTGLTASQVRSWGLPLVGPVVDTPALKDSDWVDVEDFHGKDWLLLTMGGSWAAAAAAAGGELDKASGIFPVLHRVREPPPGTSRHSVPYLVRILDRGEPPQ